MRVIGAVLLGDPELAGGGAGAGAPSRAPLTYRVEQAADPVTLAAYHRLRRAEFVDEQGLFSHTDLDDADDDPRTVVLIGRDAAGEVVGGVRLGPVGTGPDLGWWTGGRLVVRRDAVAGAGAALVRAAVACAENAGVLRFEATVQVRHREFFHRLGWQQVEPFENAQYAGNYGEAGDAGYADVDNYAGDAGELAPSGYRTPHLLMRRPIGRIAAQVAATKRDLGALLAGLAPGGTGFVGDDGAPVPGSDLIAACDAVLPSMVERDPDWAGWCAVLVNLNDLAAMGATPIGLLDALGARDHSFAARVLAGLRRAAQAYDVPILGGHTQFGVPAALSVTALGRAAHPVRGGGGRAGDQVRVSADLAGGWRAGYGGRQWDSTSGRRTPQLQAMLGAVGAGQPGAAKDVSMAGLAGSLGMLAEASACGAVLDVAAVPRPRGATVGDWLTCFPGFAMITTDRPGTAPIQAGPAVTADCGELVPGHGVHLRWPDGRLTEAITDRVTGMGRA